MPHPLPSSRTALPFEDPPVTFPPHRPPPVRIQTPRPLKPPPPLKAQLSYLALPLSRASALTLSQLHPLYLPQLSSFILLPPTSVPPFLSVFFPLALVPPLLSQSLTFPLPQHGPHFGCSASVPLCVCPLCLGPCPSLLLLPPSQSHPSCLCSFPLPRVSFSLSPVPPSPPLLSQPSSPYPSPLSWLWTPPSPQSRLSFLLLLSLSPAPAHTSFARLAALFCASSLACPTPLLCPCALPCLALLPFSCLGTSLLFAPFSPCFLLPPQPLPTWDLLVSAPFSRHSSPFL